MKCPYCGHEWQSEARRKQVIAERNRVKYALRNAAMAKRYDRGGVTYEQIGRDHGISKGRARQIILHVKAYGNAL